MLLINTLELLFPTRLHVRAIWKCDSLTLSLAKHARLRPPINTFHTQKTKTCQLSAKFCFKTNNDEKPYPWVYFSNFQSPCI